MKQPRENSRWLRPVQAGAALLLAAALSAASAQAQGSRKDDIVWGPSGHPIAGATITICQANATGTPCSPSATIYTDATLTVAAPNPFQTDGLGNYHFYAPPGRYMVQIAAPQIQGTLTYPDVILPADLSSSASGNNISAFGLTLGGNLTVSGNATITGTLNTGNIGNFSPTSLSVQGNATIKGPRPRVDVTAYGALGNGATAVATTGSISSGSTTLTVVSNSGMVVGGGIVVLGAGAAGAELNTGITAISGTTITLAASAGTTVSGASVYLVDNYPIQQAINAACSQSGSNQGGAVFFPGGASFSGYYYVIWQPTTNNSPALTVPSTCTGGAGTLMLEGTASTHGAVTSGSRTPQSVLTVINNPGSSGRGPLLQIAGINGGRLKNLSIKGWNQGLQLNNDNSIVLDNVSYSNANSGAGLCSTTTCTTDNVPLAIYNSYWIWQNEGSAVQAVNTLPAVAAVVNACPNDSFTSPCQPNEVGLFRFDKFEVVAGGIYFDQRIPGLQVNGNIEFRTLESENLSGQPLFSFNSTLNSATYSIQLDGENWVMADCGTDVGAININTNHLQLYATLRNVYPCSNSSVLVKGAVANVLDPVLVLEGVNPTQVPLRPYVQDVNGNAIGQVSVRNYAGGIDYVADTSIPNRLRADWTFTGGGTGGGRYGCALRLLGNAQTFAALCLDPKVGALFNGTSSQTGFTATITQNSPASLDIEIPQAISPTGLAVTTSTSGGTLAAGTYYYSIQACNVSSCTSPATQGAAGSPEVSITTTGSTSSNTLTWNAPGGSAPVSCNIYRSTVATGTYGGGVGAYSIANCTTTLSFTDTGGAVSIANVNNQPYNATYSPMFDVGPKGAAITGHLNQAAANQFAGSVTLSAGTATFTFPSAYTAAPICALGASATGNTLKYSATASAITITSSSGTDTQVVSFICAGNPN